MPIMETNHCHSLVAGRTMFSPLLQLACIGTTLLTFSDVRDPGCLDRAIQTWAWCANSGRRGILARHLEDILIEKKKMPSCHPPPALCLTSAKCICQWMMKRRYLNETLIYGEQNPCNQVLSEMAQTQPGTTPLPPCVDYQWCVMRSKEPVLGIRDCMELW